MRILIDINRFLLTFISVIFKKFSPVRWKEFNELNYWKYRKKLKRFSQINTMSISIQRTLD